MSKANIRLATDLAIDKLRRQLEEVQRKLRELLEYRAALESVSDETLSLVSVQMEEPEEDEPEGTHFYRILSFLRVRNNQPQTIADIEKGTGIPRASISAVLYRTHPKAFINLEGIGGTRAKCWRLRTSYDDDEQESNTFTEDELVTETETDDIPF